MLRMIFLALLAVGVLLLALTAVLAMRYAAKKKNRVECEGTIVGFYENTSEIALGDGEHVAVSPVVEYRVNGVRHEFTGNYYNTGMQIGDKVKVLYRSEDPSSATMKGAALLAPLITGAVSLTFIIIGVVYLMIAG